MKILALLATFFGFISWLLVRKVGVWNPPFDDSLNAPVPEKIHNPTDMPSTPTNTPQTPVLSQKHPSVADFCNAIAEFEGGTGDANHLNNNPGNCRFNYAGYMPMYGVVKCSPKGFAIFKDWATGMLYLNNMTKGMIHNHPGESILEFMTRYAPSFENPTIAYANFIAKKLGVDIYYKMSNLG